MSDNWIRIIFIDPYYIPFKKAQMEAELYFKTIAPNADEIKSIETTNVEFYDAGVNFRKVFCPFCKVDIGIEKWQEMMDKDYSESGFRLEKYKLDCCKNDASLNMLKYDFDQGFGKYCLDVMSPNIGELNIDQLKRLEEIFMKKIKVIYQHI